MNKRVVIFYSCLALFWFMREVYVLEYNYEVYFARLQYAFDWYVTGDVILYSIAGAFVLACVFDASRYFSRSNRWRRKYKRHVYKPKVKFTSKEPAFPWYMDD